jgi:hypothetical protein
MMMTGSYVEDMDDSQSLNLADSMYSKRNLENSFNSSQDRDSTNRFSRPLSMDSIPDETNDLERASVSGRLFYPGGTTTLRPMSLDSIPSPRSSPPSP